MNKKTRSDAWESKLDEETRSRLYLACAGAKNFHEAKLIAKDKFDVRLPAEGTWYRFLDRMRNNSAMLVQKAAAAARDVKAMSEHVALDDTDLVNSFKTLAAEATFRGDQETAKLLFGYVCDIKRLQQKDEELRIQGERLKVLEAKEAKLVKAVANEKLTDEDRVKKIKSIFGIK